MDFLFDQNSLVFDVLLFAIGLFTGFLSSMGGAGGLILLPFMIACGIPPALALGTARTASLGAWLIALRKFHQAEQVRWKRLPVFVTLAVIAGVFGTYLMIDIDNKYVYPIVGTLMVLIAPLAFLNKDFGLQTRKMGRKSTFAGYILYFLVMIYGGFFGAGARTMSLFVLVTFSGFRALEAHATEMVAWIIMVIISSVIFLYHDQVNYFLALILFVGMAIGSFIGSRYALKGGDRWIKIVVCSFSFIIGAKLLIWG